MRKSYLLLAGAGAVLLAACSGDKKVAMNDDLKNDLELASSSDGITLANSSPNAGQQVISAIERTTPPTRQPAPSTRVRRHKAAPKTPPQVVQDPSAGHCRGDRASVGSSGACRQRPDSCVAAPSAGRGILSERSVVWW